MLDKLLEVIDRLTRDAQFRELLQQQPEQALAGYHLSREEYQTLKELSQRHDSLKVLPSGYWQ